MNGARPAALLLTGGASRRMGQDKALLDVSGRALCLHTADLLAQVADPVVEVGPGYTGLARAIEAVARSGPLAAVAAGAEYLLGVGHLGPALVVATDLPRLTVGLLDLLATWPGSLTVVPLDRAGRAQPLCARYSPTALALAVTLVAAGERSMRSLLEDIDVIRLHPRDWIAGAGRPDALVDVDTPADLAALRAES